MNSWDNSLAELWTITRNLSIFLSASNTTTVVGRCLGTCCIVLRIGLLDGDVDLYNAAYVICLHCLMVRSHILFSQSNIDYRILVVCLLIQHCDMVWCKTFFVVMLLILLSSRVVRLSILFSVLRIVYPSQRLRTMMCTIAVLFIVMFLSFIGAKVWFYTRDLSWTQQPSMFDKPTLPLGRNLVIYELASESYFLVNFPVLIASAQLIS